ncbi:FCD domain-containing protein [Silicimonas algicola]|uniref:GntR family transcriptional regulator n=1 Tax=Silicimonas algicola TaxID=1826607 RepID=A0A316G3B7_9RHOB|nr:FCD domain-containing protein [Silicimonas algicola]AZQ67120.1 FCD domain-containing protein [Silicimonas algicola]PWK55349.1 GntR family transcriptional regulator [Silicimonas algicola]
MNFLRFETDAQDGETIGDVVYRRLRSDIVNGALKPLEKLKLDHMRDTYGLSVPTAREILNRLVVEQLVTAEGQRGFRVAPISRQELADLADLRKLLETNALRRSIAAGDLEWEGAVVSAHHKLSTVEQELGKGASRSVAQWVRYDWGFHHATIAACDQVVLMQTHATIFDRYARYHMLVLDFRSGVAADHRQLRDHVLARDADAAEALLVQHIERGMQHILGTGKVP